MIHVGPYLIYLFVYRCCGEDLSVLIFFFHYFDLFQVKVQLLFKCGGGLHLVVDTGLLVVIYRYENGYDCNLLNLYTEGT
jgi:hypothetical protein